jgi:hypothetical protein
MAYPIRKNERSEQRAAADFVATLTTELAELARRHGLDTLGYILEMARMEAESLVKGTPRPQPPLQQ